MSTQPNRSLRKGRGATLNRASARFDAPERVHDGDWEDARPLVDGEAPPLRTEVTIEQPRSIISRNTSPDIAFDRSVNAYRGCEHGCIYCFARPTHAFHDLSPGLDFETRLFAKPDAPALLRRELSRPGYKPAVIAMGTNTDPYQPIEERYGITRGLLQVLAEFRHPVMITTKSDRIARDVDLLAPMAADGLASAALSVTSLDPILARKLEPRAPSPARRLKAVEQLARAGIPVAVLVAPVIPALTDHELEGILRRAAEAGASGAAYIPLRLPHEVAPLFRDWLAAHYPDRAAHVMSIVAAMRGGRDNDPRFHQRMQGSGPHADLLAQRFRRASSALGLAGPRRPLRTDLFTPPGGRQLSFL